MRILVLNGPNLNLLGRREPDVYGDVSLKGLAAELMLRAPEDVELTFKQSTTKEKIKKKIKKYENSLTKGKGTQLI